MREAVAAGRRVLAAVAREAAERASRTGKLADARFTARDRNRLASAFAASTAAADLLGRLRARRLAAKAGDSHFAADSDVSVFADLPGVPQLEPTAALDYFLSLVPELGVDPRKWAPAMYRRAFTLARATEQTTVVRVHRAVAESLRGGEGGTAVVHRALTEAGLSDENGSYAELVWRSSALDAYNAGIQAEIAHPDVAPLWGGWQYLSIPDDRARPTHAGRHNKLYPMAATFAEVRGTGIGDIANCRCTFSPLTHAQLAERLKAGAALEDRW